MTFALREIGGAVAIGAAVGVPAALLTGRLRPGEPMKMEALGVVFLCAGLAVWQEVSFLLAGMVAGATLAALARHHERPLHAIEDVEWPFLVLFFLLAGASFETEMLGQIGTLGAVYIVARILGRLVGGWIGGRMVGMSGREGLWTGAALMPQAGVALGMALVAGNHLPEWRETVLSLTIASTIVFEVAGPFATRLALDRLRHAGDALRSLESACIRAAANPTQAGDTCGRIARIGADADPFMLPKPFSALSTA